MPDTQKTRDSEKTKKKIIRAVGRLLAREGFGNVGINAVAREAGVDKVLIYRYFGGLPELLREYAAQGGFWPANDELMADLPQPATPAQTGATAMVNHLRALRSRKITQEIMRWELIKRNSLTDELAMSRERQGMALLESAMAEAGLPEGFDIAAPAALIHAGITYLILRSKTADVYMGLDLKSDEDWTRIEEAAARLVNVMYEEAGRESRRKGRVK